MIQIQLVTVGRLKGAFSYVQVGIDDYVKRLRPFASITVYEVADESILPSKTPEQIMLLEAQRILPFIQKATLAVALSEQGDLLSSEAFTSALWNRLGADPSNGGILSGDSGPIIFIVGGALGLHPTVLKQCHWMVSLSRMTFPHPLVRLIFLEQLYRSFKIARGEPYHK